MPTGGELEVETTSEAAVANQHADGHQVDPREPSHAQPASAEDAPSYPEIQQGVVTTAPPLPISGEQRRESESPVPSHQKLLGAAGPLEPQTTDDRAEPVALPPVSQQDAPSCSASVLREAEAPSNHVLEVEPQAPSPQNSGSADSKRTRSASRDLVPPPKRPRLASDGDPALDNALESQAALDVPEDDSAEGRQERKSLATTWSESILTRESDQLQARFRVFSNEYVAGAAYVEEDDRRAKRRAQAAEVEEDDFDANGAQDQKPAPALVMPHLLTLGSGGDMAHASALVAAAARSEGIGGGGAAADVGGPSRKAAEPRRRKRQSSAEQPRAKTEKASALPMLGSAPPLPCRTSNQEWGVRASGSGGFRAYEGLPSPGPGPQGGNQVQRRGSGKPGDIPFAVWPGPSQHSPGDAGHPQPNSPAEPSWAAQPAPRPTQPVQGAQGLFWPPTQWPAGVQAQALQQPHGGYNRQGLAAHQAAIPGVGPHHPHATAARPHGQLSSPVQAQFWQPHSQQPGYMGPLASWPGPMMVGGARMGQYPGTSAAFGGAPSWGPPVVAPAQPADGPAAAATLFMTILNAITQPAGQGSAPSDILQKSQDVMEEMMRWGRGQAQGFPDQQPVGGVQPLGSWPAVRPLNSAPSALYSPPSQSVMQFPEAGLVGSGARPPGLHPMVPSHWSEATGAGQYGPPPTSVGLLHPMRGGPAQFSGWAGMEGPPTLPAPGATDGAAFGRPGHASQYNPEIQGGWRGPSTSASQ